MARIGFATGDYIPLWYLILWVFQKIFLLQEFVAKCLSLPGESEIADLMEVADPDAIHTVRRFIIKEIAANLREELLRTVCLVPIRST